MTGVSEDTMNEFSIMFKHFDKNQTGKLEHEEFRSCLRSLGYDLRGSSNNNDEKMSQDSNVTQDSQEVANQDHEFQAILDIVDPNQYVITFYIFLLIKYSSMIEYTIIFFFHYLMF